MQPSSTFTLPSNLPVWHCFNVNCNAMNHEKSTACSKCGQTKGLWTCQLTNCQFAYNLYCNSNCSECRTPRIAPVAVATVAPPPAAPPAAAAAAPPPPVPAPLATYPEAAVSPGFHFQPPVAYQQQYQMPQHPPPHPPPPPPATTAAAPIDTGLHFQAPVAREQQQQMPQHPPPVAAAFAAAPAALAPAGGSMITTFQVAPHRAITTNTTTLAAPPSSHPQPYHHPLPSSQQQQQQSHHNHNYYQHQHHHHQQQQQQQQQESSPASWLPPPALPPANANPLGPYSTLVSHNKNTCRRDQRLQLPLAPLLPRGPVPPPPLVHNIAPTNSINSNKNNIASINKSKATLGCPKDGDIIAIDDSDDDDPTVAAANEVATTVPAETTMGPNEVSADAGKAVRMEQVRDNDTINKNYYPVKASLSIRDPDEPLSVVAKGMATIATNGPTKKPPPTTTAGQKKPPPNSTPGQKKPPPTATPGQKKPPPTFTADHKKPPPNSTPGHKKPPPNSTPGQKKPSPKADSCGTSVVEQPPRVVPSPNGPGLVTAKLVATTPTGRKKPPPPSAPPHDATFSREQDTLDSTNQAGKQKIAPQGSPTSDKKATKIKSLRTKNQIVSRSKKLESPVVWLTKCDSSSQHQAWLLGETRDKWCVKWCSSCEIENVKKDQWKLAYELETRRRTSQQDGQRSGGTVKSPVASTVEHAPRSATNKRSNIDNMSHDKGNVIDDEAPSPQPNEMTNQEGVQIGGSAAKSLVVSAVFRDKDDDDDDKDSKTVKSDNGGNHHESSLEVNDPTILPPKIDSPISTNQRPTRKRAATKRYSGESPKADELELYKAKRAYHKTSAEDKRAMFAAILEEIKDMDAKLPRNTRLCPRMEKRFNVKTKSVQSIWETAVRNVKAHYEQYPEDKDKPPLTLPLSVFEPNYKGVLGMEIEQGAKLIKQALDECPDCKKRTYPDMVRYLTSERGFQRISVSTLQKYAGNKWIDKPTGNGRGGIRKGQKHHKTLRLENMKNGKARKAELSCPTNQAQTEIESSEMAQAIDCGPSQPVALGGYGARLGANRSLRRRPRN